MTRTFISLQLSSFTFSNRSLSVDQVRCSFASHIQAGLFGTFPTVPRLLRSQAALPAVTIRVMALWPWRHYFHLGDNRVSIGLYRPFRGLFSFLYPCIGPRLSFDEPPTDQQFSSIRLKAMLGSSLLKRTSPRGCVYV